MHLFIKALCLGLVIFVFSSPLQAQETCLLVPASLQQRVAQATLIVEGKVLQSQSFWDQAHRNIYTANRVQIYKVFKGDPGADNTIEIITEGGSVGDDLHTYSNTLNLQPNQQGVFFLEKSRFPVSDQAAGTNPAYSVYASSQGFIRYNLPFDEARDSFRFYQGITSSLHQAIQSLPQIQVKTVRQNPELEKAQPRKTTLVSPNPKARTQAAPVITDFTPDSTTAGTGAILTITGNNFGQTQGQGMVEFKNANDGAVSFVGALPADYISWTDNEIKVKVSSNPTLVAASGEIRVTNNDLVTVTSEKALFIKYAISSVLKDNVPYPPHHVNKDGNGGYIFRANNSVNAEAAQSFARALQTWTCQTAMNWELAEERTSTAVNAEDGVNVLRFSSDDDLPANILGRTTSRYKGCRVGDGYRYWVDEIDMVFNDSINWNNGNANPSPAEYDFETVALHELGHAHQLGHIYYRQAIMHYAINRGQVTRRLSSASDIDGGNYVLTQSFRNNVCGPTQLVPLVAAACPLPAALLSFTATSQPSGEALLAWQTTLNADLGYFLLERSYNGVDWRTLTEVIPQVTFSYTVTDSRPFKGFTYYRLRLVYNSPGFVFSPVRRIGSESSVPVGIALFPNPIQDDQLHLEFQAPAAGTLLLNIYDTAGRLHGSVNRLVAQGNNPFYFSVAGLNKGLYLLQAITGSQTHVIKFIKL